MRVHGTEEQFWTVLFPVIRRSITIGTKMTKNVETMYMRVQILL